MRPSPETLRRDVAEALTLLTVLPVPVNDAAPRGAAASWAWPLAGVTVALVAGSAAWMALAVGLPATIAALLAVGVQMGLTGGLHEDGLADCGDGFGGRGRRAARRLEIMRDSRIGSYGATLLLLVTLLRWTALEGLLSRGEVWGPLVAAAALSRAGMPLLLAALPPARPDGLARLVGRPEWSVAWAGVGLALVIALLASGPAALVAALLALVVVAKWGWLARRLIGGQTGDVCGAVQQTAEAAVLVALLAL